MVPLSPETKRIFLLAMSEASRLGHTHIESEHLLLGLARIGGEVSQELLNLGLTLERLRLLVGQTKTSNTDSPPTYTAATKQLVALAKTVAQSKRVTPKDLLRAISQTPTSRAYEILKTSGSWERLELFLQS
mgnify:CR=1 FL=1